MSPGVVGRPLPHESAVGHVTGQARYTGDLPEPPGLLHGWPVMASHARARVVAIDGDAARATPGVVAVLTAREVPGENDVGPVRRDEPLFPAEVVYHGQAVAWALGESEAAARLGAGRVAVGYTPLPGILTLDEAIARESYHTETLVIRRGDPERALGETERVLSGELRLGGQDHFYLEPHVALADFDEQGELLVHSSTQHPTDTQEIVARVLGLARHQVIVRSLRMGGAFGGKEVQANPFAAVAALGAWTTRRPVRVRLNRDQDMMLTGKRHPFLARFRVGFDAEGELLAVAIELIADGGFSLDLSEAVLMRALFHLDNAYYIPHLEVRGRVAKTNTTSHTAFRGFGGPQGMVVIEEIVDRVARTLGLPPEAVRERNLYRGQGETNTTHYGQEIGDNRLARIWSDLVTSSELEPRRAAIAGANAGRRHVKRGLAITPVKFGISFTLTHLNQAGALVLVYQDGTVQVNHGGTEMGQGLHTKVWQVAAESSACRSSACASCRPAPTRCPTPPPPPPPAGRTSTARRSGRPARRSRPAWPPSRRRSWPHASAVPSTPASWSSPTAGCRRAADPGTAVAFGEVAHRA